jgi:cellulose 1,4-beta-cellobiosidase
MRTLNQSHIHIFIATLALGACASGGGLQTKAITAPTTPPAPAQNPFAGGKIYGDPEFSKMIARATTATPEDAARLKKVAAFPVAFWLESLETAKLAGPMLDEIAKQQAAGAEPLVPTFVVYNLPNRDCAAAGSRGELSVEKNGEALYQSQFIDVIAAAFKAHPNQKITVVLEPDSLPNLVTNSAVPACAAAEQIYRRGVAYAIAQLSLPNVYVYMDAAHAGWLGWPKNLPRAAQLFKEVIEMAGGPDRIRGFALNVSNYNPPRDPKGAKKASPDEPSQDEIGYAEDLAKAMAKLGIPNKGFIIDTSRSGKAYIRSSPGNWCNVKGAGLGERPRAAPAPNVDAYLWVKTPGESDGTADPKAARFDENCVSDEAMPGAPEAGELFAPYLIDLAKNAEPPL